MRGPQRGSLMREKRDRKGSVGPKGTDQGRLRKTHRGKIREICPGLQKKGKVRKNWQARSGAGRRATRFLNEADERRNQGIRMSEPNGRTTGAIGGSEGPKSVANGKGKGSSRTPSRERQGRSEKKKSCSSEKPDNTVKTVKNDLKVGRKREMAKETTTREERAIKDGGRKLEVFRGSGVKETAFKGCGRKSTVERWSWRRRRLRGGRPFDRRKPWGEYWAGNSLEQLRGILLPLKARRGMEKIIDLSSRTVLFCRPRGGNVPLSEGQFLSVEGGK